MSDVMRTATMPTGGDSPAIPRWTQQGRLIAIETDLGPDKFLLTSLSGEETMSRLFDFEIVMLSPDQSIAPESLIGHEVKLVIDLGFGQSRAIHGMIAEFRSGPIHDHDLRVYRARVVPWLWFLDHATDCRVFQNLNVPAIIEQVFATYQCADFQMAVTRADYPDLEFCVQYRESAFNFVSRLMEQVGLFYFFRHEDHRHVLVIGDKNVVFQDLPEPRLTFGGTATSSGDALGRRFEVTEWEHVHGFRTGGWAQKDFNFKTPSTDLRTAEKSILKLKGAEALERFDYPGGYGDKGFGGKLTRTLMEAEEAAHHAVTAASNEATLCVGAKFTLRHHPVEDDKTIYVIRQVRHDATENAYLNHTVPSHYENTFVAMPYDKPFRPLRLTEKPFVHGPQTAIVVGPPGEAIHTDTHGRVRVQFHWDRHGKKDDKSSCWIRVSQSWAGVGWGAVNLPHVGHEVVVSFLEGDPDRPLITGRVYNGENGTAMGMPANKTQSAMRDHSGNEIVMEGKSGSEDIRINATKDTNVVVTHDYNETVKTGNRKIDISAGTHTETIKGDTKITITTGALTVTVAANTATYNSVKTTTISSTSADVHVMAKTQIALDVGSSHLLMMDNGTVSLNAKNITIHGSESVKVFGDQTVKVSGDSIGISAGNETKIGVGGQNTIYDKQKVSTSGAGISSSAVGEHDITGAIVKIN